MMVALVHSLLKSVHEQNLICGEEWARGSTYWNLRTDIIVWPEKRPQQERGSVRGWLVTGISFIRRHNLYYAHGHVPPYLHFAIYF